MAGRNAISNIGVLKIEAAAILRSIRSDPDPAYRDKILVLDAGYTDRLVTTIAAIMNEIASTSGAQRFPMAVDDVANALKFLDLLTAFDMEVKLMSIYKDDDETQEEPDPA